MSLSTLDWVLIALFLLLSIGIAIKYASRAGESLGEFFLSGRQLPWYIAGFSMVATTFAADTPLAVTEIVNTQGISGNWFWWNMLIGGMLTTFFFAKMWRRANIMTDVEFVEIRYSGKPAAVLRGFKAVYLGLFMNSVIIGWVNVALVAILRVFFDIPEETVLWYVAGIMLITALYSSLSGLWGVAITDFIQFVIAMTGCIVLSIVVLQQPEVGGIAGLKEKLPEGTLNFLPTIGEGATSVTTGLTISVATFMAFIGVQWWASWYPGAEPGGGGYVAQRMMSAKDEKSSLWATLFFQVAHYCLRPWPWILVGLCTIVLYSPQYHDCGVDKEIMAKIITLKNDKQHPVAKADLVKYIPEYNNLRASNPDFKKTVDYMYETRLGYVYAMRDFLPSGLKGLLLVAFLAAYMSTISTQLNWGASYFVNDLYKRFLRKEQTFSDTKTADKHYVTAARIFTLVAMAISLFATTQISSIRGVWGFVVECGAGLGLVLILRWYWWRINAWSEIAATATPFIGYSISKFYFGWSFPDNPEALFFTVGITTVVWIAVTFITKPEPINVLGSFYERVQPGGAWKPVRQHLNTTAPSENLWALLFSWVGAILFTYSLLFGIGKIIFGEWILAAELATTALAGFLLMRFGMRKTEAK